MIPTSVGSTMSFPEIVALSQKLLMPSAQPQLIGPVQYGQQFGRLGGQLPFGLGAMPWHDEYPVLKFPKMETFEQAALVAVPWRKSVEPPAGESVLQF